MSRHVRATVAVAALSLAVLGPPVQAQDTPSAQGLADLRARAEAGDATAQWDLGLMYGTGRKGTHMIRHAVCIAIAALSLSALGSPVQAQDKPSAQELADLRARAEAGDTEAQYNLGLRYATGKGVQQDDAEAVAWYHQAAEQGHAKAQTRLGVMYDTGKGVPHDDAEAAAWYPPRRGAGPRRGGVQPRADVLQRLGRRAG